jgi:hypothetical protein
MYITNMQYFCACSSTMLIGVALGVSLTSFFVGGEK